MTRLDEILRPFDYVLPPALIAQRPASPRDGARLLVHERTSGKTRWARVRDIEKFLPAGAVLVLNETKVIPARLPLDRETGGKVAILRLGTERGRVLALSPKALRDGETLRLGKKKIFLAEGRRDRAWVLRPLVPLSTIDALFEKHGHMPLPPYIKHSPLSEKKLRTAYQSVFAKERGSIAAPTASLHFTRALLQKLRKNGITLATVTLHVHLGTFAPLTEEQWASGKLHAETYAIPAKTVGILERARREGRPIVAVGTTALRTLESASDARGNITKPRGTTRLFIRTGYRFRIVDGLLTNFHVPRSSLLMLVSAFAGRETILQLYAQAIRKKFRFFSFGDAMLIL